MDLFKPDQLVALIQYESILAIGEYSEMKQLINENDDIYVSGLYRETDMQVSFSDALDWASSCGFAYDYKLELWYCEKEYNVSSYDEYFCDHEGQDLFTLTIL